jgi:glycosyltransferase involved in cell wall biosynthesis
VSGASISAFFPAYNDWGTIASQVVLTARVLAGLTDDWEIVVVNDASPDHCADVLEELVKLVPNLRVVTHEKNRGYGGALRSGFAAARKEWIFYTDGDAQYDVTELPLLWQARQGADLVNGYKILRHDPLHRVMVGKIYHQLVKWAFRLEAQDVDCDFRLIHRRVFDAIELTRDTGLICVELVSKIEKNGFAVRYVPVHHYARLHGRSQFFNFRRVAEVALGMGRLWWEIMVRKQIRR